MMELFRTNHAGDDHEAISALIQKGGGSILLRKCCLKLVHSETQLYQRHWRVEKIRRLAIIECALSLFVFIALLVLATTSPMGTQSQWSAITLWVPPFSIAVTLIILLPCWNLTYAKLHSVMALGTVACVGWLTLVLIAFFPFLTNWNYAMVCYCCHVDSCWYHRVYKSTPFRVVLPYFILTAIILIVGLVQLVLSFTMVLYSGRAMSQGRSTLEGQLYTLEPIGENDGAIDKEEKCCKSTQCNIQEANLTYTSCEANRRRTL